MPLTPPGIADSLMVAFAASGMSGTSLPQLALGVGTGVSLWLQVLTVVTADTGAAGSGVGAVPCAIPQPLLLSSFLTTLPASGIAGVGMPLLANGLANGLSTAFLTQGIITTVHPVVGVGVGMATFPGPSCVPHMLQGLASVAIMGVSAPQLASGIGLGLDAAFSAFTVPVPIVGVGSAPVSGVGTGKVV